MDDQPPETGAAYKVIEQAGLGLWPAAHIDAIVRLENIKLLQTKEALDEFRDKGTVNGKNINQLISNNVARRYFKPTMNYLDYLLDDDIFQEIRKKPHFSVSLAFSPDGTKIASISWDHAVRVWTLQNGDWLSEVLFGHTGLINYSIAFSPDGTRLASGSINHTVYIWTLQADGIWQLDELTGHTDKVTSVAFSSDGTHLVSGSSDHRVRIWTLQHDDWQSEVLTGHTAPVNSVVFSPDGTHIASGSADHTIRVWTLQPDGAYRQSQILTGHTGPVNSVVFSPDGTHLVSGSDDHTIRVWTLQPDASYGQPQILTGHTHTVNSIAFSPDGTRLVSGSSDHTVRIWTLQNGDWQSHELIGYASAAIDSIAFSPNGRHIISLSWNSQILVWTQVDFVGNDNVAAKIMLLQLLSRDGKDILKNKPLLQNILATFDNNVFKYLVEKYSLSPSDTKGIVARGSL